jgi:hypothetical protein
VVCSNFLIQYERMSFIYAKIGLMHWYISFHIMFRTVLICNLKIFHQKYLIPDSIILYHYPTQIWDSESVKWLVPMNG